MYELDLRILKMYLHTGNELSVLRLSNIEHYRQTDRQKDRQTDATENITTTHSRLIVKTLTLSK